MRKKANKKYIILLTMLAAVITLASCFTVDGFTETRGEDSIFSGIAEAEHIDITTQIPGQIEDIKVQEGQVIMVGDIIATLDSTESKLKLEQSEIALESAENELDRVKNVRKIADENVIRAAEYAKELAEKNKDLAEYTLSKTKIVSKIGGVVETVNFHKGEYVNTGSPIVTITNNEEIWVRFFVPEKVLPNLRIGQEVTLSSEFLKDKEIKGQISYISSFAEFTPMNTVVKEDRTRLVFEVRAKILNNKDAIKPGMLLDININ